MVSIDQNGGNNMGIWNANHSIHPEHATRSSSATVRSSCRCMGQFVWLTFFSVRRIMSPTNRGPISLLKLVPALVVYYSLTPRTGKNCLPKELSTLKTLSRWPWKQGKKLWFALASLDIMTWTLFFNTVTCIGSFQTPQLLEVSGKKPHVDILKRFRLIYAIRHRKQRYTCVSQHTVPSWPSGCRREFA